MTDERYVFMQDIKDKKRTARGAFNKRTHNGKGGPVRFPSDFMSRKEKKAMNGECKTYQINRPMTYREFKAMPNDLQITYVKQLRETFGATDVKIAEMLGTAKSTLCSRFEKLGLGRGTNCKRLSFNEVAWEEWLEGRAVTPTVEEPETLDAVCEEKETIEQCYESESTTCCSEDHVPETIPFSGSMSFEGKATDVLRVIARLLGDERFAINVSWVKSE